MFIWKGKWSLTRSNVLICFIWLSFLKIKRLQSQMIPKWPNFGSGIWVDLKNFCYWDLVLIYTCKNSIISSSSCVSCNGLGHDEVCASSWWICDESMTYFRFQLHSTPIFYTLFWLWNARHLRLTTFIGTFTKGKSF
jgi:hypothetical protein